MQGPPGKSLRAFFSAIQAGYGTMPQIRNPVTGRIDHQVRIVMRPSEALKQHREEIRQIAEQHHTRNPRVFGSVLHGMRCEESDT